MSGVVVVGEGWVKGWKRSNENRKRRLFERAACHHRMKLTASARHRDTATGVGLTAFEVSDGGGHVDANRADVIGRGVLFVGLDVADHATIGAFALRRSSQVLASAGGRRAVLLWRIASG